MKGIRMYYEYCNYNTYELQDIDEEQKRVFSMMKQGLNGFATDIFQIREFAPIIPEGFVLAGPVDYPIGRSDRKVRQHQAITLLKAGANAIDLVCHRHYMGNDWPGLKSDILCVKEICRDYNATLRIMINYQDDKSGDVSVVMSDLLADYGADVIIPSLGYHNEDFYDTLIMSHVLNEDKGIPTICNGHAHLPKHIEALGKTNMFGFRVYSSNYKLVYN